MNNLIARSALSAAVLLACMAHSHPAFAAEYSVTELPNNNGNNHRGNSINNRGWVAGYSNFSNGDRHATLWVKGQLIDLGTLGGPNSSVTWPVNANHLVAGISQTNTPDPLGENWSCSAFFLGANPKGYTCLGFVWKDGVMKALPTLGGNNGFATGANNRGEVVGWAETDLHDPTCVAPQQLQFLAVKWDADSGRATPLLPLPGESASAATAINDNGVSVGISGICDQAVGRHSARHAVLWQADGTPVDLGNVGGGSWNTPYAVNNNGDVVGFASTEDTDPDAGSPLVAFIWTQEGGMQKLGFLDGDNYSEAHGINNDRQVVGLSCGGNGCRAFLWENGTMHDLNALAPSYDGHLQRAEDINDDGVITGRAISSAGFKAFVATPIVTTSN